MADNYHQPTGIDFRDPQINLYTSNMKKSYEFYYNTIGLEETFRTPKEGNPDNVEFKLCSTRLGIATVEALEQHHGICGGAGSPREELILSVDDADGAYSWAVSRGFSSLSPPKDFPGYEHSASITDPDGNPVRFTTQLPLSVKKNSGAPPIIKNHLINLFVNDIEKSLRFYHSIFGFKQISRTSGNGSMGQIQMELGNLNLGISAMEYLNQHYGIYASKGPPRGEVAVWVDDVDSAYSWLITRHVPFFSPPHNFAGVLRAAFASDPDGNPLQIVSRQKP